MQIVNAGVSGWIWDDLEVPGVDTVQIQDVDPVNSWGKIVDFGCRTTRNINDVFFWNNHLAFFVGDGGFLCRYSLRPDPHGGPGLNIAKALLADRDPDTKEPYLKWEAQGADEQALNWGKIVDEPAYRYANFRSVFCLQVGPINIDEWVAFEMNADLGGSTPHSNLHPLILTLTRTLTPTLTLTLTLTLTVTLNPAPNPNPNPNPNQGGVRAARLPPPPRRPARLCRQPQRGDPYISLISPLYLPYISPDLDAEAEVVARSARELGTVTRAELAVG